MEHEGVELTSAVVIHDEGGVDAQKLSNALEAITDQCPPELRELNTQIKKFLNDFLKPNSANNAKNVMHESRIKNLLSSSVSRVITKTVPLYPQGRDISEFIRSIGIKPVDRFLVMKADGIELITHQHILNYVSHCGKIEDLKITNIRGDSVPEIERTCTIQQAIKKMEEEHTSCLLIKWNSEEKRKYMRTNIDQYPPVVTQNQINILLLQTLMEDGYIDKEVPQETVTRIRTALDDLEEEEQNDVLNEKEDDKSDDEDVIIDSNQVTLSRSNPSLSPTVSSSTITEKTPTPADETVDVEKKRKQRKRIRSVRRVILKTVSSVFVVFIMWIVQIIDIALCFCFLSDIYNYLKSEVFLVFSILFAVEDLLNIVGDSVVTQSGQRRIVINMIDILLIVLSIVYYFIPCPTDRFCRIMGSILVLFKFIRSYKLVVYQKNTLSSYFRKKFNRNRNQLGDTSLDMSFITGHIIAMSWPGSLIDTMWRNNISDVESFLNHRYGGNYWVINLCAEKKYGSSTVRPFGNRFTKYSIRDHNACSLTQICYIIDQCQEWFNRDPHNVVAIHCKGGKGRTGMIVSCLLLKVGVQIRPADALELFAVRRTTTNKNKHIKEQRVSSPSQNRYVFYYNYVLENGMPPRKPLVLKGIIVPNFHTLASTRYQYILRVYDIEFIPRNEEVMDTWNDCMKNLNLLLIKRGEEESNEDELAAHETWTLRREIPLTLSQDGLSRLSLMENEKELVLDGDVRIELIVAGSMTSTLGFVWFNTAFATDRDMYFSDCEIDDCSTLDRNLYIRLLVEGNGLDGTIDYASLPQMRQELKKSSTTETPTLVSDSSSVSSLHSVFSKGRPSSRSSRSDAPSIESVSFRTNRTSRKRITKPVPAKQSNVTDLELFERAKLECEMTAEEREEREKLLASLTPEERKKMEQYRIMCEEANDIFKSISLGDRGSLFKVPSESADLDVSMIPALTLPTLNSEGEEEDPSLEESGESEDSSSINLEEEEEEEEEVVNNEESIPLEERHHRHHSIKSTQSNQSTQSLRSIRSLRSKTPSVRVESTSPRMEGVFIDRIAGESRYSHTSLSLQQQGMINIPDLSSDSE